MDDPSERKPDESEQPPEPTEFEKFENMVKRLVKVPKPKDS